MGQHHFVTIHGRRYSLEDLQHGAHPSVSTQTVIARLRRGKSLQWSKTAAKHEQPRGTRSLDRAIARYLTYHDHPAAMQPLGMGLLFASLTLMPLTFTHEEAP